MLNPNQAPLTFLVASIVLTLPSLIGQTFIPASEVWEFGQTWYMQTMMLLSFALLGLAAFALAHSASNKPLGLPAQIVALSALVLVPALWFASYFIQIALLWVLTLIGMASSRTFEPIRRVLLVAILFWTLVWVVVLTREPTLSRLLSSLNTDAVSWIQWGLFALAVAAMIGFAWFSMKINSYGHMLALIFGLILLTSLMVSLGWYPRVSGALSMQSLPPILLTMAMCFVCTRWIDKTR